ncbi:oligopeptide transport system permease protein [Marinococcus luteus]|uniref:Oligopeptide transport system permease protein n=1 Tax=Marinococcus luteus TaxID=1122204 RepID=A0A1H2W6T9_9BACI|nr:oligopeptide ABC transporter permease [Marinococcus luteus]SDW76258.1 oligopeptide transport system permease protein [Marinococcus luteus]
MARYIVTRIVYMVITLFIIASITFFLMKLMPGTPLSAADRLPEAQQQIVLEQYGLDKPVPLQYVDYMLGLVQGDLGVSFQFDNRDVSSILENRIGPSLQLGIQSLIIGSFLGAILGLIAAIFHNGILDFSSTLLAVIGTSIPSFIFAGLLQYYLGVQWQVLPVATWGTFAHTIMPTIALLIFPMAICARFMRTEMLEVLNKDYIMTARAKGVKWSSVILKHGLRNALIPLITVLGPLAVSLLTGTLVIEQIFAVPGIGEQFVTAVTTNDYPMIMGTTLFFSFLFVLIILIIDILYGIIDPRIRLDGGK